MGARVRLHVVDMYVCVCVRARNQRAQLLLQLGASQVENETLAATVGRNLQRREGSGLSQAAREAQRGGLARGGA